MLKLTKMTVALSTAAGLWLAWPAQAHAACPDWTRTGQTPEYPRDRYLVGMGVASNVPNQAAGDEPAKAAAMADMAKQVLSQVSATTTIEAQATSGAGSRTNVKEKNELKSSIKLPDAQVVARCFDPQQATMYALAVVERGAAIQRITATINAAAENATTEMSAINGALKKNAFMTAIDHLKPAREAVDEAETQLIILRAMGGAYKGKAPSRSDFKDLARVVRSKTRVTLVPTGDGGKQVAAAIMERLTKMGVEVQSSERGAAVVITIDVSERALVASAIAAGVSAQESADVQVRRTDTDAVVAGFQKDGRGVGRADADARSKAFTNLATAIGPAIESALKGPLALGAEGE